MHLQYLVTSYVTEHLHIFSLWKIHTVTVTDDKDKSMAHRWLRVSAAWVQVLVASHENEPGVKVIITYDCFIQEQICMQTLEHII